MTRTAVVALISTLLALACAACATRPAADFSGRWKPVNHFAETAREIPLHRAYVFYPSPMDGTLKKMLERWAADSSMTLSYLHPSDFTLPREVAAIRTGSVAEAARALSALYAEHGVAVTAEAGQLVVRAGAKSGSAGQGANAALP